MKSVTPFSKLLSVFLAFVMVAVSLPVQAISLDSEEAEAVADADPNAFLVEEDLSKRGQFEKHYLCSDGTYVSVAYPEAVHYLDENGVWQDVDRSLTYDSAAGGYACGDSDFSVLFSDKASSSDTVRIEQDGYSLSWGILTESKEDIREEAAADFGHEQTDTALDTSAAVAEPAAVTYKSASERLLSDENSFVLPNVSSQISYAGVSGARNVSLKYTVYQNKIEEDILISERGGLQSVSMNMDIGSLTPVVNADGSVDFTDADGEMRFRIGIPYMTDAAFSVCNDILVTAVKDGSSCVVTYTPDAEWFESEDRTFPILLDPSVTTNDYVSNIEDTYVEENTTADHSSEQYLYISQNGDNRRRAIVRVTKLPEVDASMPIISATLTLTAQYAPFGNVSLSAAYLDSGPELNEYDFDVTESDGNTYTAYSYLNTNNTQVVFDFSPHVYEMYSDLAFDREEGYDYHGDFVIGYANSDETAYVYPFCSSECTTVSDRPVFTVRYGYSLPAGLLNGGVYSFRNRQSFSYMSVNGANPVNGSNIYQLASDEDTAQTTQKFKPEYVPETGGYLLRSMASSSGNGMVVDISRTGGELRNGCNVQLYTATDPLSQEWLIVPVDYDVFRIVPRGNMSLTLAAYGSGDGTDAGRTSASAGNIFVETGDRNNRYQEWYIYDSGDGEVSTMQFRAPVESGNYYISNSYIGGYLHRTNGSIDCVRATMDDAGESTVKWVISNLGDGYCTIGRSDLPGYYITPASDSAGSGVRIIRNQSETIPDRFKWLIVIASNGGCLIQNKQSGYYLCGVSQSANPSTVCLRSLYPTGTDGYRKQTWRIASEEFYKELSRRVSFNNITVGIGTSEKASINKSPSRAVWASFSDFDYVIDSGSQYVTFDAGTQMFTGRGIGTVSVTAVHKVTGISACFIINVQGLLVYRTRNRERLGFMDSDSEDDISPITAEDLTYGCKDTSTLTSNGTYVSMSDLYSNGSPLTLTQRVTIVKNFFNSQVSYDATFVSILSEMVDHFVDGGGSDYSNAALTNAVKNHSRTQSYVNAVSDIIIGKISQNSGNVGTLQYDEQLWVTPAERSQHVIVSAMKEGMRENSALYLPSYGYNNGEPGLTLAINGWYGNKIEIESFEETNGNFVGTLRFTFYDHFGLDTADLSEEKYGAMKAGAFGGFRQWYILQHWNELGYTVQPKPFLTVVSYTVDISGTIN